MIGQPSPGIEMKIVKEKEGNFPVNTTGEIFVKSKAPFEGYFNDRDATKACLAENGWVRIDDIGFMDEYGMFYCEGRKAIRDKH